MTSAVQTAPSPTGGGSSSGSLADVIETILDKGLVIDAHVSVAVVGIQIVTIDARVVVASVDTYLRFAEACNRLDLDSKQGKGLPEVVEGAVGGASDLAKKRAIGKAGGNVMDKAGEILGELVGGDDDEDERERRPRRKRRERE